MGKAGDKLFAAEAVVAVGYDTEQNMEGVDFDMNAGEIVLSFAVDDVRIDFGLVATGTMKMCD